MAKKHNRRPGYWKVYGKATPQEKQSIIDNTVKAVKNNPPRRGSQQAETAGQAKKASA